MSQTTFLSDVLSGEPVPKGKLAYFQARLSNLLHGAVLKRFMQLEKEEGFTRAELARRIGRKPEQVTRWLGSPGNWTLETLSDLLIGMGCELDPRLMQLGQLEDAQALAFSGSWPIHPRMRAAVINAVNQPVHATFNQGQTIYMVSVPARSDNQPHSHAVTNECDMLATASGPTYDLLSSQAPSEYRIIGIQRSVGGVMGKNTANNRLATDSQGQSALLSELS